MPKIFDFAWEVAKILLLTIAIWMGLNWLSGAKIHFERPESQNNEQSGLKSKPGTLETILEDEKREGLYGAISLGGYTAPDGTPVQIDFPLEEDIRNIGSKIDSYGLCVMSSIEMSSRWNNLVQARGIRDWAANFPGGGYPVKVDKQIKQFCKENNIEIPPYLQYEGRSLEVLEKCLKTYRIASVTYNGRDGVRYRGPIAHMVNLVHLDDKWAAIYDNNGKAGQLIWMTPREFRDRWLGGGNGWAFFWLTPPPPPKALESEVGNG